MTVARDLAKYAIGLDFSQLPDNVVKETKRVLLDTIGCAIGGYKSDASRIIQKVVSDLGGTRESTIIGSGLKTSCQNAALVNGVMVRYLDYNDVYIVVGKGWYVGGHPSEVIPGALAVAERQHASGRAFIEAVVVGYESYARFHHSTVDSPMAKKGWLDDTKGIYVMPLVAGKLLGLDLDQMENAVGISGCHNIMLNILDAPVGEYSMTKNLRFPFTAEGGIMAALLAQQGFTGPATVIEGDEGFAKVLMGGEMDLGKLTDFSGGFEILNTWFKAFAAVGAVQGIVNATLNVVKEHDIKAEDVAQIKIKGGTRTVKHTADPTKLDPQHKETADHSCYYTTARAILDREVGPDQYTPDKLRDPRVRELIKKITVEIDPDLDRFGKAGITEILTKQGARYTGRVEYPKGDPLNPMTDEELEAKFRSMALRAMSETKVNEVISIIQRLEDLRDMDELTQALVL